MNVTEKAKKHRQLKTTGFHLEGNAEHEKKSEVCKQSKITENTATIAVKEPLMEEILGH